MKYCKHCQQKVVPKKKFNWWFFLLTAIIGIGFVYLIWYIIKFRTRCPICGARI